LIVSSGIGPRRKRLRDCPNDIEPSVKRAALALIGRSDDDTLNAQLLADIRDVFAERKLFAKRNVDDSKGLRSADLVGELIAMPDRPWGECNYGKAITANWLARRLKLFGIYPCDVHDESGRSFKGYSAKAIREATKRYISQEPPDSAAHPRSSNQNNSLDENQSALRPDGRADENSANRLNPNDVRGCADKNPQHGESNNIWPSGTDEDPNDEWEDL
jgi:Protein of unknown function (DUF3631)